MTLDWPLMRGNLARADLDALAAFLSRGDDPVFTQGAEVRAFEREWSAWLGTADSVFVSSGSSANLVTMAALRHLRGPGEVIVPPLTWSSDIASVLHVGLEPVFVDIDPRTLGLDTRAVLDRLGPRTRAVFLTHVLGYSALDRRLLDGLRAAGVPLVEDVAESYGATHEGRKLGTFGWASNVSFYYAHHLTTGEGGMVSADDPELLDVLRMLRAHGLVRGALDAATRRRYAEAHPDLSEDFIFAFPAWNVRGTEPAAVLGRSQLRRLDARNEVRRRNLEVFLSHLDPRLYVTDFAREGSCNYAFTLVLREKDEGLRDRVVALLREQEVEFRRGLSGGGNQLRQPYLRGRAGIPRPESFPHVEHVHFFGFYIGNYPDLPEWKVVRLCELLNALGRPR
jgi:CDP-6-deoxy-D-xylo-4-hexulose-3-dehydrase